MLYGDTVGKIFERLYRDRLWVLPDVSIKLLDLVRPILNSVLVQEVKKGGVFDWTEPKLKLGTRSVDEVEREIRETIPRGIRSIKKHCLIGMEANAEVVLDTIVEGKKLKGRADFIIRRIRPHNDLVIVDGKGSRWREKYTDDRQLLWYAMLYWLRYGVIPDRLGFLFWRYDPEQSMDWKGVTQEELESLKSSVLNTFKEIEQAEKNLEQDSSILGLFFQANPRFSCKFCDYLPLCSEGAKYFSEIFSPQIFGNWQVGVEDDDISF